MEAKDVAIVVADKSMQMTVEAILERYHSIQAAPVSSTILTHIRRDGGVRSSGPELLAGMYENHKFGILMLDFEGSGTSKGSALELEIELDNRLEPSWSNSAKTIVIEPELDIWMWGSDNALQEVLGWDKQETLRYWLISEGYQFDVNGKPERPKEALAAVLRLLRRPQSSALYAKIVKRISLARCIDPSFIRFRDQLQAWLPTPDQ